MNTLSGIAVLIVVLFGGLWLFEQQDQSSATISDTEIIRSSIQSETVDVSISVENGAIATFTLKNMAPGDQFRGKIVIGNSGSVPLLYGVTSAAEASPLNKFLEMRLWSGPGECSASELPGDSIYAGGFTEQVTNVVGVWEAQTDFRPLAAGQSETLCAQIILPTAVGNEAQNQVTRQRFTVLAIQDVESTASE